MPDEEKIKEREAGASAHRDATDLRDKKDRKRDRDRGRGKDRENRERKTSRKSRRRESSDHSDQSQSQSQSSSSDESDHRQRRRKKTKRRKSSSRRRKKESRSRRDRDRDRDRKRSKRREKKRRRYSSSSSSSGASSSESSSSSSSEDESSVAVKQTKKVINQRLLKKLAERGETLQEREQRRTERRAARITAQFGYTSTDNPFNDPNLAETFSWKKKDEVVASKNVGVGDGDAVKKKKDQHAIIDEIEKVRRRRREYEEQKEEMERIRAEESRMKELENYDEWARKEEEFHLQQQRQRSAIRLVEGREKPIDVLAKNLLMFGLSDGEKKVRAKVKYQEKYDVMEELENLEAELEEPHVLLNDLKLNELEELLADIHTFRMLEKDVGGYEREGENTVLRYWDSLHLVTRAEIQDMKSVDGNGKDPGSKKELKVEMKKMFEGQSKAALEKMKEEVEGKVKKCILAGDRPVFDEKDGSLIDMPYWQGVLDELLVHLAKMELSEIHSKMLVCQLEQLEKRKEELANSKSSTDRDNVEDEAAKAEEAAEAAAMPENVAPDFGNLDEELGLTDEIELEGASYIWQEKYRPRKPRYFNRVKTGYDWNKYNQTHYDHDNPPPKTVQGYKFNIFYPDLIDRTKTPRYFLEPTKSNEFCILRFSAGPPYEDIAFKIINREWNKSRKRGFKCTFERGVLSLYFNFKTHWYRK